MVLHEYHRHKELTRKLNVRSAFRHVMGYSTVFFVGSNMIMKKAGKIDVM